MAQNKTSRGPRNKTKRAWMQEHVTDQYVKRASLEGYRSRAVYKLQEILARDKLVKPGMCVVDLGAAPGGWSQLIAPQVRPGGTVFALDLLEMAPVADVHFIQGDFREETVLQQLNKALNGRPVDLVLSDMAPNISGIASMDQARSAHLVELALEFAGSRLKPGGALLVKVFQGEGVAEIRSQMNSQFESVVVRKPAASRDRSKEFFLLARGAKSPGSVGSVA